MESVGWLVRRVAGWTLAALLGAFAFVAALVGFLGGAGSTAGNAVAIGLAVAASGLAILVFRRANQGLNPHDPIHRAIDHLPPGALVRRGRTRSDPTIWIAMVVFVVGAVGAVIILGYGGTVAESIVTLSLASTLTGGLLGIAFAEGAQRTAVLVGLLLSGGLATSVGAIAIIDPSADDWAEIVATGAVVAVATAGPLLAGSMLGRTLRIRSLEGRPPRDRRLSGGLERAMDHGRTDAVVWEYPYGGDGERQLAIDRTALAGHGYDVLVEDRHEPSSLLADAAGLVFGLGGGDQGSIRVLYGRPRRV
jgi:MFS family permease